MTPVLESPFGTKDELAGALKDDLNLVAGRTKVSPFSLTRMSKTTEGSSRPGSRPLPLPRRGRSVSLPNRCQTVAKIRSTTVRRGLLWSLASPLQTPVIRRIAADLC